LEDKSHDDRLSYQYSVNSLEVKRRRFLFIVVEIISGEPKEKQSVLELIRFVCCIFFYRWFSQTTKQEHSILKILLS
jgi:hypothetical protein